MKLTWTQKGWDDYVFWQSADKKALKRINKLIKDILRDPFVGIGDPEPLKHSHSGYWSRRIDKENRLIYKVKNDSIEIIQCRYHYSKH